MANNGTEKFNGKEQPAGNESAKPEFLIHKIYIEDSSFESPHTPDMFNSKWEPEINLDLNSRSRDMSDDAFEVVLTLTLKATNGDKNAFLVEIQQAGIFTIKNFPDAEQKHLLGSVCPGVLFPYAREVISDLVVKGGFPALYLTPINFDALYMQHVKQEQAPAEDATEVKTTEDST